MSGKRRFMEPEDYTDPACPFCTEQFEKTPPVRPIPADRVIRKLDEHLSRNDFAAAERHLLYWLAEAEAGRDLRGEFLVRGELVGLYRKLGREKDSLGQSEKTMELVKRLGMENSLDGATAMINRATALKAFGHAAESLPLFEKARAVYESSPAAGPEKLGGLYNNYALALTDAGRFGEARTLYGKALAVMEKAENGEPERAVTWLNLADLETAEKGPEAAEEAVSRCLAEAERLLDLPGIPRDGNYAFICEKCAPTFSYYGWFMTARELARRSAEIYGREGGEP